jgi:arylsulfatase
VRRDIDWELARRGIDFMKRQKAADKPFFLYLPISRTHFPNLPSTRFAGASRIGQFGDSLMEGDAIVGRMLDALQELGIAQDTIVVFASDNGPQGEWCASSVGTCLTWARRALPRRARRRQRRVHPHCRTDPLAGSDRTEIIVCDDLDHGFLPDACAPGGGKVPDDRPIDGIDQTDLLLGRSETGRRDALLTFVGPDLVASALEAVPRLFCRRGFRP